MFALHKSNYKLNPQSFLAYIILIGMCHTHPITLKPWLTNEIVLEINLVLHHKFILIYPGYFFKVCSKICYVINHLTDT